LRIGWPQLLRPFILLLLTGGNAEGAPEFTYRSLEAEAASELQAGEGRFGPSFLRLIGRAELAVTENLTAKATVSPCGGPYSTQAQGVTECSVKRLVEEFTLGGVYSDFDFSFGRQVITQGNTEGFVLLDRFNGRDLCRFARLDIQNKLPNWIGRGRAFLGGSTTLAVTYATLSGESEIPDPGSYCDDTFHDAGRFAGLGDPMNNSLGDGAGGAELAVTRDKWSAALNVMSVREDLFVLETVPVLEKTRPRTLWLGSTASATLGGIVVRGELAFAPERAFTINPEALGGLLMQGIATNGVDQRWNLLGVAGVEGQIDAWSWSLQYFHDRVDSGPALARDQQSQMASLRVRKTFANDRVTFDGFTVFDIDYRDLGVRASVSYEINEAMRVAFGGTAYADFDNHPGLFGSYVGRESVYVKLIRTLF
jgi:hypothetical protein